MTTLPRRRALLGMVGLLAAPAIIRTPGLLMPVSVVKPIAYARFNGHVYGITAWNIDFERMVYQWHDKPIGGPITMRGEVTFDMVDEGLFILPPDVNRLRLPA